MPDGAQRASAHRRRPTPFPRIVAIAMITLVIGSTAVTTNRATPPPPSDTMAYVATGAAAPGGTTAPVSTTTQSPTTVHTTTLQETAAGITYDGVWSTASHDAYRGKQVLWSKERGAAATVEFTGTGIAWIGPTGPTRGKARVYIDGRLVRTVDTYSATFDPSRVLFSTSFRTERQRTLEIVVLGTTGRPYVAIDALVVRGSTNVVADAPPVGKPDPLPTPAVSPTPGGPSIPGAPPSPVPAATPTPTPAPTGTPSAQSTPLPVSTPTPMVGAAPTPTAPPTLASGSVRVTSVAALLGALADNAVTEIVVADGRYVVSPAGLQRSNSLWIGQRYAGRTNPVTVRAETRGGVTFDGNGTTSFGGLSFEAGAHHQTWDGFTFANGTATETGVVTFGGYAGLAAPHHITLRNITFLGSCRGRATAASGNTTDHAIYVSKAVGGVHDVVLEDVTVDGSGYLASAIHFFHSDSTNRNAWNVTIRRLKVNRTQQAIILWDRTLKDVTIDGATITNALSTAVRYEGPAEGILLRNITSTGSGQQGFYSSLGSNPPGVTFSGNSFD